MMGSVKTLIAGIVLIVVLGVGSLVYRNALEHPNQPVACPLDAKICPDGTSEGRTGLSCTFPPCPPPNDSIDSVNIAYAVPDGFSQIESGGAQYLREYASSASSTAAAYIAISDYPIAASSTALATIEATAISGTSGAPVPQTAYSAATVGDHRFTVVEIERFEGTVDTAYYLARAGDVLRFEAIDHGADWTNPALDVSQLPAHAALLKLLATLQGQ